MNPEYLDDPNYPGGLSAERPTAPPTTPFTPGPWEWKEQYLNDRAKKRHGSRPPKGAMMVFALKGPLLGNPDNPDPDRWDFRNVMELSWGDVRGTTTINVSPSPANAALIAASPTMYEKASELLRLWDSGDAKDGEIGAAVEALRSALPKFS